MDELDYDAEQISLDRQQRMADFLRQQGASPANGRMVGRTYVKASPFQHLANLVNTALGSYFEREADTKRKNLVKSQSEAFEQTLSDMPRRKVLTRSVRPDVSAGAPATAPGVMPLDKGTVDAQASSVSPVEQSEVINPTREDMLQWSGKLYRLPMARQLATKLMADYSGTPKMVPLGHIGILNQDTGDMTPFKAGVDIELAKLEQHAADLRLRLADKALDRQLRDELSQRLIENEKLIAQMRQPDSRLTDARIAALESQATLNASKAQNAGKKKPMPKYMEEGLQGIADDHTQLIDQLQNFKDEYAGMGALGGARRGVASALGSWGSEDMQKMDAWWRAQERFDELPQRYKLFGATLTPNELKSWKGATIRPGLSPEKVREFINTRISILKRKGSSILNKLKTDDIYETSGTEELFGIRGLPTSEGAVPTKPGAPASAVKPADLSGAVIRRVK